MHMHPRAVIADNRLGHESSGFSIGVRDVMHYVFEYLRPVGPFYQAAVFRPDFALSSGSDLVMMHFNFDTQLFQRKAHRGADIVQGVNRRDGKITAFYAWTMTSIAAL